MSAIMADALAAWRECRDEYSRYLEAAYAEADAATRGNLLNRRGRAAGIASASLFLGPRRRAEAYASDELREWWQTHPRLTYADFERQWIDA